MGTLVQDLRFGARQLLRNPGFTVAAVLSLALGIGANTTIFTLVNAVLLHPLPMKDAERLVAVFTTDERNRGQFFNYMPTSRPNFLDYREGGSALSGLVAYNGLPLAFSGKGEPEQIVGEMVSGDFFEVLGVKPALGRAFLPDEDKVPGAGVVAVLSHNFWQRRLGGDPTVVGREITLNGHAFTVVGIAPPGFKGANTIFPPALWVPTMAHPQLATGFLKENMEARRALLFNIVGRLKAGVTLAQAQAELQTIAGRLAREYPDDNGGRSVALLPLAQATINPGFRDNMVSAAGLLLTVVGLVLLIACANVANLLLARASVRQREVAVRLSLGASRGRLVRQLLTEGLLLAAVSGAVGLLIAYWAQGLLWSQRPPALTADALDLALNGRVLVFTLGVSLATALVFGLAPALTASRPDVVSELKQRGGASFGNRPFSLRGLLVAGQVALSMVALVGAGLFVKSLRNAQRIDPGFDHERLAVLTVDLGAQGYREATARDFHRRALERAAAMPGVERATLASGVPLIQGGGFMRTVFLEGADTSDRKNGKLVQLETVEPGYFETMGIPLTRGRDFARSDHEGTPHVVVVNETMARQFWPEQDPIGKRFKFFGQDWLNEVVGVARDAKYNFLGENPQPHIYLSLDQTYEPAVSMLLRSPADPAPALGMVRREVQGMDKTLPITGVFTFGEILRQSLWAPRMGAWLLAVFGLLSLVLAVIGVYGVMSYSVSQRTLELGLRTALGADQRDLLRLVVRQGLTLAAVGIVFGVGLSLAATRLVGNLLFDVNAQDPVVFAGIAALLGLAALVACAQPAWRAARVDPTVALRVE